MGLINGLIYRCLFELVLSIYGGHEFLLMVGGLYSSVNSFQRRLGDFVAKSNRIE